MTGAEVEMEMRVDDLGELEEKMGPEVEIDLTQETEVREEGDYCGKQGQFMRECQKTKSSNQNRKTEDTNATDC